MTTAPENPLQVHSNDVHASRFAPHGEFRIWTEGAILCYDATGPFNLEALHALDAARAWVNECLTAVNGAPPV